MYVVMKLQVDDEPVEDADLGQSMTLARVAEQVRQILNANEGADARASLPAKRAAVAYALPCGETAAWVVRLDR